MGIKISDLPDAEPLDGSEYIAFVQNGVTVKKRVVDLFVQPLVVKADGNSDAGYQTGDLRITISDNGAGENKATLQVDSGSQTINE
jgi:hypothetical protein